ncbi:MAG TPA: hypothetical protein VMW16_00215 [Sedimentisphaerales bacterium]|nr:hypothetical protein [Sedimentisphaerales bacterium]
MKTQKLTMILAAAILIDAVTGQAAKEPSEPAISNTRTACCLVKVTADPAILPVSLQTIDNLLSTSGVAGKAAREALDLRPDQDYEFFSTEMLPSHAARSLPEPESIFETGDFDTFFGPEYSPAPAPASIPPAPATRTRARPVMPRRPPEPKDNPLREAQSLAQRRGRERYTSRDRTETGQEYVTRDESVMPTREFRRSRQAGRVRAAPPLPVAGRTLLFRLRVHLPEDVKPAAREFMTAVIDNLCQTLNRAFDAYRNEVRERVRAASFARDGARDELENVARSSETEADLTTRKQLDEIVDLSALSPEMPFGEAIELLQDSVGPPLKLIVLWRDLQENTANIDHTTPINMDPISAIPLGKALELLLRSVSAGEDRLSYEIDRGVITIATAESLPSSERRIPQVAQTDTPVEMLLDRKNELFRDKQELEMEIARQEARRSAIEEQIVRINDAVAEKVKSDPTAFEIQRLIDINARELERAREALDSGRRVTGIDEVTEKIARAKIDLARRREELSNAVGGSQLARLSGHLTDLMIDLAERRAELDVVGSQFEEIQEQLRMASAFDPQASQIRLAREALEIAEHRVNALKEHLASLQPPTVTVLGAE